MDRSYRFGVFLFDAARLELTRDGRPVPLQPQPAKVLAALLDRPGQPVTRDELRRAVWPDDTFVDFDRGLNFCIAQIRTALGDDAGTPRYIRTLPKKGYEFICPLLTSSTDGAESAAAVSSVGGPDSGRSRLRRPAIVVGAVVLIAAAAAAIYVATMAGARLPVVAVARFDNETGDPNLTRFADAVTDTVVEQLTQEGAGQFAVVGNAAMLRGSRDQRNLTAIASSLHAGYVVLGQIQRDAQRFRVLAHLIRLPEQTHLK